MKGGILVLLRDESGSLSSVIASWLIPLNMIVLALKCEGKAMNVAI